jgi:hypothetical protein
MFAPSTLPLPPLPAPDAAILNDFLALRADLHALASKLARPLHELIAWAAQPLVSRYIANYATLEDLAHAFDQRSHQSAAITSLESLRPDDPIESRRVAQSILRGSTYRARKFAQGPKVSYPMPAAGRTGWAMSRPTDCAAARATPDTSRDESTRQSPARPAPTHERPEPAPPTTESLSMSILAELLGEAPITTAAPQPFDPLNDYYHSPQLTAPTPKRIAPPIRNPQSAIRNPLSLLAAAGNTS